MLKPKKKITKKELKQDKFVLFTLKARDFIDENAKLLVRVGIGVLIVIILASFYIRSKRNANTEANEMLGEAQMALNQNNTTQADTLLKDLVKNYDGVTAAGQGCYLLARSYWQKSDYANAKIYFKKYVDEYADDDLLTSASLAGYGDCLMQEGNVKEAADYYEKAGNVNKDLPMAPSYFYSAAQAYMQINDLSKAQELAEFIVKNYENSEYKNRAEILLGMVRLKA